MKREASVTGTTLPSRLWELCFVTCKLTVYHLVMERPETWMTYAGHHGKLRLRGLGPDDEEQGN
jgi:hypothetical protein